MPTALDTRHLKDLTIDDLRALSREADDAAWLAELRVAAFTNFLALPWPDKKDERWKRTDFAAIGWDALSVAPVAAAPAPELQGLFIEAGAAGSGRFTEAPGVGHSAAATAPGVTWTPLREAARTEEATLRPMFSKAVADAKDDKVLSLTLALATNGWLLKVSRNSQAKDLRSVLAAPGAGRAAFAAQFIAVEEGAEAQLWTELAPGASDGRSMVAAFTAVDLGANAHANVRHLQHWGDGTAYLRFQTVDQAADSHFSAIDLSVGGRICRNESIINLRGSNARNKVLGIVFGDGSQTFENRITQNHVARATTSDIQYRGALKGSAYSFFTGMVDIRKEAQQSDAFQSSKTMLLSKNARADAIPNLEILADDVKCSHGAAVGPVDPDQTFYLQTRGVPATKAEEIIIQGFFDPVVAEVPSEPVQERLRAFIEAKLHAS